MSTRFALYPAGSEDTASSRIRVYTLERTLASMGIAVTLGPSRGADVLFIQKKVTPKILKAAQKAKRRGSIVLYDVDDLGEALSYWVPRRLFDSMLHEAHAVTTDTIAHREMLLSQYRATQVELIPDTIDYYPTGPVQLPLTEGKPLRVLWFGTIDNVGLFERYIAALTALQNVQVVAATADSVIDTYQAKYSAVQFLPWSRSTFISLLQSCHLTCLMHDGSEVDRAKSNNKLITSINLGVPSVVSRTPEYERTAREAGVEHCVFENESELRAAVERLRSVDARSAYLATAQPYVWDRYAPAIVAQQFLQVTRRYLQERSKYRTNVYRFFDRLRPPWRTESRI